MPRVEPLDRQFTPSRSMRPTASFWKLALLRKRILAVIVSRARACHRPIRFTTRSSATTPHQDQGSAFRRVRSSCEGLIVPAQAGTPPSMFRPLNSPRLCNSIQVASLVSATLHSSTPGENAKSFQTVSIRTRSAAKLGDSPELAATTARRLLLPWPSFPGRPRTVSTRIRGPCKSHRDLALGPPRTSASRERATPQGPHPSDTPPSQAPLLRRRGSFQRQAGDSPVQRLFPPL